MAKIRIVNETGHGWDTKVTDEFGNEIPGITGIHLNLQADGLIEAEIKMIMPTIDLLLDGEVEDITSFDTDRCRKFRVGGIKKRDRRSRERRTGKFQLPRDKRDERRTYERRCVQTPEYIPERKKGKK
jgi:hypothetical protein